MKRGRTEPVDEEAAAEDPWIWVEDAIPTSEEMRNRKREDLAEAFAKEMTQKPSPWKFWFPKNEKEDWVFMFEKKGFAVKDLDIYSGESKKSLYQVKISTKKKQKVEEKN